MKSTTATIFAAIGVFVVFLALIVIIAVITALPVMWLLNWLIAPTILLALFGTAHIGFWKAYGIAILCSILFKGITNVTNKD